MKYLVIILVIVFVASCQVTETMYINADGSGSIEVEELRDENIYMQVAGERYSKEEVFEDTTYSFKDIITKYNETFLKYPPEVQLLFQKYSNVKAHIKKNSFEKEFRTTITQNFSNVYEIPDLYKTVAYTGTLKNNYVFKAGNNYYKIDYNFDGKIFKRLLSVTDATKGQKIKENFREFDTKYTSQKLKQYYVLQYHFPRKIISCSNEKAVIALDKKSLRVEFALSDSVENPEITNLQVVLE